MLRKDLILHLSIHHLPPIHPKEHSSTKIVPPKTPCHSYTLMGPFFPLLCCVSGFFFSAFLSTSPACLYLCSPRVFLSLPPLFSLFLSLSLSHLCVCLLSVSYRLLLPLFLFRCHRKPPQPGDAAPPLVLNAFLNSPSSSSTTCFKNTSAD